MMYVSIEAGAMHAKSSEEDERGATTRSIRNQQRFHEDEVNQIQLVILVDAAS